MKLLYSWMENTAMKHAFLKFDQSQTDPRFSIKPQNPRWNRKTPDLVKNPQQWQYWLWLFVPQKVRKRHILRFCTRTIVSQTAQTCAALVLTDLSTPHSAVIPQPDVTRTSHDLKQKRIVTLLPGRTDPRISPRRPNISIKLISRAAWANHGNCQCAEKIRSRSC